MNSERSNPMSRSDEGDEFRHPWDRRIIETLRTASAQSAWGSNLTELEEHLTAADRAALNAQRSRVVHTLARIAPGRFQPAFSWQRGGPYGEVKRSLRRLGEDPTSGAQEDPLSARSVARVLITYRDSLKSLLMLADFGPLSIGSLSTALGGAGALDDELLEMLAELHACGQLEISGETLLITQHGTQTVNRLRGSLRDKGKEHV
jgi:hypothetical protein